MTTLGARLSLPFALGLFVSGLVACTAATEDPSSDSSEASPGPEEAALKKKKRVPACLSGGSACTVASDACCTGTACVKYTVYDHPRCMRPLSNGKACEVDAQCKSNTCVDNTCRPAPTACLSLGDACVVGDDTCCAGSCVEYTVYDYPRCRK